MSLTRKKLKAIGLTEEQVESVIEDHAETVRALQEETETFRKQAETLPGLTRELEELKKKGGEDYKTKYEREHADFEAYKNAQAAKETRAAKERALRDLIRTAGISERRVNAVLRVSDLDSLELDENGKPKNGDEITAKLKEEFSDFIETVKEEGADVASPPEHHGGDEDLGKLDMAAYIAKRKTMKG